MKESNWIKIRPIKTLKWNRQIIFYKFVLSKFYFNSTFWAVFVFLMQIKNHFCILASMPLLECLLLQLTSHGGWVVRAVALQSTQTAILLRPRFKSRSESKYAYKFFEPIRSMNIFSQYITFFFPTGIWTINPGIESQCANI